MISGKLVKYSKMFAWRLIASVVFTSFLSLFTLRLFDISDFTYWILQMIQSLFASL